MSKWQGRWRAQEWNQYSTLPQRELNSCYCSSEVSKEQIELQRVRCLAISCAVPFSISVGHMISHTSWKSKCMLSTVLGILNRSATDRSYIYVKICIPFQWEVPSFQKCPEIMSTCSKIFLNPAVRFSYLPQRVHFISVHHNSKSAIFFNNHYVKKWVKIRVTSIKINGLSRKSHRSYSAITRKPDSFQKFIAKYGIF